MRTITTAALLLAGLTVAASAQTASGGMQSAQTDTVVAKFVTVKPASTLSSKLIGLNLYNSENEKLGDIEDLVIENGKTVTGIVVSVGGFLGMGERYVVIEPSSVTLRSNGGTMRATTQTTKDDLKNAPTLDYSKRR